MPGTYLTCQEENRGQLGKLETPSSGLYQLCVRCAGRWQIPEGVGGRAAEGFLSTEPTGLGISFLPKTPKLQIWTKWLLGCILK